MGTFFQNVRFGWRTLTRNQGFAVAAVLALALGIGPNVAIFSIIYATFLAPMPYQHPEQLAVVWTTQKGERIPSTANTYLALRDQAHSFQALSFSAFDRYSLTSPDHVDLDITGSGGTGDSYWEAPMLLGRNLQASDSAPGHDHVVVLQIAFGETTFTQTARSSASHSASMTSSTPSSASPASSRLTSRSARMRSASASLSAPAPPTSCG